MKIIIAGGTGFFGAAIVARLLSEGLEVVVLDRGAFLDLVRDICV